MKHSVLSTKGSLDGYIISGRISMTPDSSCALKKSTKIINLRYLFLVISISLLSRCMFDCMSFPAETFVYMLAPPLPFWQFVLSYLLRGYLPGLVLSKSLNSQLSCCAFFFKLTEELQIFFNHFVICLLILHIVCFSCKIF